MKKKLYFLTAACLMIALAIGCKDENEEPEIPTNLAVDKTSLSVDALGSTQSIAVFSNKEWNVKTEASWLTLSPASGKADSWISVEIIISGNPETEARNAAITVTSAEKTIQVELIQHGKEIIPFIPGIEIADAQFKQYLIENFDTNGDGEISTEEAEKVTFMDCSGLEIESLAGLEYFVSLDTLLCANNQLIELLMSGNSRLKVLDCNSNKLVNMDISSLIALEILICQDNELTGLDLSNNVALKFVDCSGNRLTGLNMSNNTQLTELNCMNNELATLEIGSAVLTNLNCSDNQLTGLELNESTALANLNCSGNQLTGLDLSENTALANLNCSGNQLTGLDLSNNSLLLELNCINNELVILEIGSAVLANLNCSGNHLDALDLSNNTALSILNCSGNQLTVLDISNNAALKDLNCSDNDLTVLDVSKNASLEKLDCRNNESLAKILLAEDQVIPELLYDHDITQLTYPEPEPEPGNNIDIPDANFKAYLIANFDRDKDGEISKDEALLIREIQCRQLDIASLTGIESFPNLEILTCMDNLLTVLDISENLKLRELECSNNNLGTIDVSKNVSLTKLYVLNCRLSALDVKANTELVNLNCSNNMLTELDLSNNVKLERLYCQNNNLKTLDLRKNGAINTLNCRANPGLTTVYLEQGQHIDFPYIDTPPTTIVYLSYITISDKAFFAYLLENFDTDGDGRLSNIEVENVTEIDCSALGIASLEGIDQFTNLTSLICSDNQLTSLNVSLLTSLVTLICDNNKLERLDVSQNAKLVTLDCSFNGMTSLIFGSNKELKTLICNDNELYSLVISNCTGLETLLCQNNRIFRELNVGSSLSLNTLNCQNNPELMRLTLLAGQVIANLLKDNQTNIFYAGESEMSIAIPDNKFRDYLVNTFDGDGDGEISRAEALLVKTIDCRDLGIYSLSGIEYFTNLTTLRCAGNQLSDLPVSGLTNLELLDCSVNKLTSLEISSLTKLRQLYCRDNLLTVLYVLSNGELTYIDCRDNKMQTINVRQNPRLQTLLCSGNNPGFTVYITSAQSSMSITKDSDAIINSTVVTGVNIPDASFQAYLFANFDKDGNGILDTNEQLAITSIDCSNLNISTLEGIKAFTNLSNLTCGFNRLTSLDLSNMVKLSVVNCHDNRLTSINVTGCISLTWLYCPGNRLSTLDVSGSPGLTFLDCTENPGLSTVYLSLANHNPNIVIKDDHTNLVFK